MRAAIPLAVEYGIEMNMREASAAGCTYVNSYIWAGIHNAKRNCQELREVVKVTGWHRVWDHRLSPKPKALHPHLLKTES